MVPISARFFATVADYLDPERPEMTSDAVFVALKGPRRGQPLSAAGLDEILSGARARAGLEQATCHQLRHTRFTRPCEAGMALEAIQAQAGHAPIESTRIYVHLANDWPAGEYRRALDKLDGEAPRWRTSTRAGEQGCILAAFIDAPPGPPPPPQWSASTVAGEQPQVLNTPDGLERRRHTTPNEASVADAGQASGPCLDRGLRGSGSRRPRISSPTALWSGRPEPALCGTRRNTGRPLSVAVDIGGVPTVSAPGLA